MARRRLGEPYEDRSGQEPGADRVRATRSVPVRRTVGLLVALAAGFAPVVLWAASPASAAPRVDTALPAANGKLPAGWIDTKWGPFGPGDRALVEGVRRADLWEGPAGQMAVQKGENARVKEIGAIISRQHVSELDPEVLKVGSQLGIALPSQPNADQQTWLGEMESTTGAAFDRVFVDRLRLAHSKVFALIASVRANTRNSVVREFAQTANKYVDNHMKLLDSTGIVEFDLLPTPIPPPPAANPVASRLLPGAQGRVNPTIIWIVLIVAAVAGGVATVRFVKPR